MWSVFFSDGKEPLFQYFRKEDALRLIECPHVEAEPGFVPGRSII
jgi:hypothetical protein